MTKEEAIKIVKDLYNKSLFLKKDKEAVRTLIPEVEESEEDVLSALKREIKWLEVEAKWDNIGGISFDKVYAWLEKQGEQKAAWSEEDYNEIETIACHLDNIGNEAMAESLLNIMDKYKSYRPQSHWKPSEKQISVLSRSLKYINTISQNYCHVLGELLAQLKKLREE